MAHYAFLDENNIVTEVIVGKDETEFLEGLTPEKWYEDFKGKKCVRTSYNGTIRKNFAGIGFTYDSVRDAFIAPKPDDFTDEEGNSFTFALNEDTCQWEAIAP